jgi:hypothetical protein
MHADCAVAAEGWLIQKKPKLLLLPTDTAASTRKT